MLSQVSISRREGGSAQAGVESTQSIPGRERISGRKRTEAGTTDDKSVCSPLARVLCVHFNMGVCDFPGGSFPPKQQCLVPGEVGSCPLLSS